ncbi:hypothetical protein [Streptacidiphilus sp. P02-A3a]|uniref:hypothetical protein n=1 Tax=Streptacidiphilus sp. P02-A3a TaxID=2704468 RepID=UPI0015FD3294|nr:hypothetical protein [Streptacidiphilus sp. P02-A3a]
MALFAVVGGHGAPGATVTALALLHAWPLQEGRRVLLAECDPDGGVILSGALEGRLDASRGLGQLGVADRQGQLAQTLMTQLTDVSPGGTADRLLLPGVSDPAQYSGLAYVWEPLANLLVALEGQGVDVLVDLGRSGATGPSAVLARRADAVLVVARSTLRSLTAAHPRITALRADLDTHGRGAETLGLVLVEQGPYKASDVSAQLGAPVVGLLPYAPAVAEVLSDGGNSHDRRFVRSPLLRASRTVIDEVRSQVTRRRAKLTQHQSGVPLLTDDQNTAPATVPATGPVPASAPLPGRGQGPQPGPMSGPYPGPVPPSPAAPRPMPTAPVPSAGPTGELRPQAVSHAR